MTPEVTALFRSTPLETLILERCVTSGSGLQVILSIPRALRSLALLLDVENFNFTVSHEDLEAHTSWILEALQQQSHSLEYFRHASNAYNDTAGTYEIQRNHAKLRRLARKLRNSSVSLSNFKQLHFIDFDYRSGLTAVLFDPLLAPPALQTLGMTLRDYAYHTTWNPLLMYMSNISCTTFSHLRLYVMPSPQSFDDVVSTFTSPVFTQTPHRDALLVVVELLKNRASVEVIAACNWRGGAFAPLLYEEPVPEELVLFDSRKPYREDEGGVEDHRFDLWPYVPSDPLGLSSFWSIGMKMF